MRLEPSGAGLVHLAAQLGEVALGKRVMG